MKLDAVYRERSRDRIRIARDSISQGSFFSRHSGRAAGKRQPRFLSVSEEAVVEDGTPIGWLLGLGSALMFYSADGRLAGLDGARFCSRNEARVAIAAALRTPEDRRADT